MKISISENHSEQLVKLYDAETGIFLTIALNQFSRDLIIFLLPS